MSAWKIVRKKPVRKTNGVAIPAFIRNGNYYLTTLDVYADGVVDCWGFVDLPLFRQKIDERWVATRPPAGALLSIHNLGQARAVDGEWPVSPAHLIGRVEEAVRDLNPERRGLIDMEGTAVEVRNGVRYAKLGLARKNPYRIDEAGKTVLGDDVPVFLAEGDEYRLTRWFVYADRQAQVGYGGDLAPVEEVAALFEDGRLTTAVPDGARVSIDGLGSFRAGEGFWSVAPRERIREALDLVETLNGGPSAVDHCIAMHKAYEENPSEAQREQLRQAYQAVPTHLRMYCGDMDSKDGPIRRILSGRTRPRSNP